MNLLKFIFPIAIAALFSCNHDKYTSAIPLNDTTQILTLALKTAFDSSHLPDASSLTKKYYFKDSILFTADSLQLNYLPTNLDTVLFKILTKDKICSLLKADSSMEVPNYLTIKHFEKSDSTYFVIVESVSCLPFGGGGGIGIYISKQKDLFKVIDKGSFSIN